MIQIDFCAGKSVVENRSFLWLVESDQQFDQRRFTGAGWSDERNRFTGVDGKRNGVESVACCRLMFEHNIFEFQCRNSAESDGVFGFRFFRYVQNILEVLERYFRFAVRIDDVAQFLQRSENKERINPQ